MGEGEGRGKTNKGSLRNYYEYIMKSVWRKNKKFTKFIYIRSYEARGLDICSTILKVSLKLRHKMDSRGGESREKRN